MDLWVRSRNKVTVISVENKIFPSTKKTRQVRSNVKTMLIVFFDIEGIVYYEFVPHGQTVNQVFYKDVLIHLRENSQKALRKMVKWHLVSSSRQCASTFSFVNS